MRCTSIKFHAPARRTDGWDPKGQQNGTVTPLPDRFQGAGRPAPQDRGMARGVLNHHIPSLVRPRGGGPARPGPEGPGERRCAGAEQRRPRRRRGRRPGGGGRRSPRPRPAPRQGRAPWEQGPYSPRGLSLTERSELLPRLAAQVGGPGKAARGRPAPAAGRQAMR